MATDWNNIVETNEVGKAMAELTAVVAALLGGHERGVIVSGPTGIGKNRAIAAGIKGSKAPIHANPTNYQQLVADLKRGVAANAPVVLNEADVIFRSERMLNVLKLAWESDPTARRYSGANIGAKVIALTNRDISTPKTSIEKENWPAFKGRAAVVTIPDDPPALWEYTVAQVMTGDLLVFDASGRLHSLEEQNAALEFFTRNLWRIDSPTPGTLRKIAHIHRAYKADAAVIERRLSGLIVRADDRPTPAPPIIVPRMRGATPPPLRVPRKPKNLDERLSYDRPSIHARRVARLSRTADRERLCPEDQARFEKLMAVAKHPATNFNEAFVAGRKAESVLKHVR